MIDKNMEATAKGGLRISSSQTSGPNAIPSRAAEFRARRCEEGSGRRRDGGAAREDGGNGGQQTVLVQKITEKEKTEKKTRKTITRMNFPGQIVRLGRNEYSNEGITEADTRRL